jgi:hypothetical protein
MDGKKGPKVFHRFCGKLVENGHDYQPNFRSFWYIQQIAQNLVT